ncbi:Pentapeptide_repeats-containing protein [Hexamita inflata]|uniref:Pentapeptide repeats-containing protein n=1 Tax=Hexamita inflata TaxID=28002 RepID=A0AA86R196_9EUKA|nr:Pentapeptide repeats-containing protein [Hexamita inflata]
MLSLQESKIQLLFIVDGYDEVQSYKRIYDPNNLLNWNCKTMFTCRSSHLDGDKLYKKLSNSQLSPEWKNWETYQTNIDTLPGLSDLVDNPFVLSMIVSVLPKLVLKHDSQLTLTSLDLYEAFVQQWFEEEEQRMFTNNVSTNITNLQKEYRDYSYRLASKMMDYGYTYVEYVKDNKSNEWTQFFDPNDARITTIKRGSPLNGDSRYYCFIHKSIQEYFAAKGGQNSIEQLVNHYDDKLLDCSINTNLITDKGVFDFHKQILQRFPQFNEQLYKIIQLSKTSEKVSIAAANAITILNYSNYSFQKADFKNIKIPGANLSLAMMEGADLRGANLSNVDFQSAWLQKAKLDGADMNNVELGQRAYINCKSTINKLKFNKSQKYFACATGDLEQSEEPKVQIYYFETLESLCILKDHKQSITDVAFSPNGEYFISCDNRTVNIYSTNKWQLIHSIILDDDMCNVDFSQDSHYIICDCGKFVFIYTTEDYQLAKKIESQDTINSIQFSNDCKKIVCAGQGFIEVWDVENQQLIFEVHDFEQVVHHAVFSPNDSLILCALSDNTIQIWDIQSNDQLYYLYGHVTRVSYLAFSPNGQYLASGSEDGSILLWDAKSFDIIKCLNVHTLQISSIQFCYDNETIMSGSWDKLIKFTSINSQPLIKSLDGHEGAVVRAKYSNNKQFIVSCSMDSTIKLWDPKNGALIQTLDDHEDFVFDLQLSQDDKFLISSSRDKTVKLWDLQTFECVNTCELASVSLSVDLHKDGKMFVYAGLNGIIEIFEMDNGSVKVFEFENEMHVVKYSHDYTKLAASGVDANIIVIDIASGQILVNVKEFDQQFLRLEFSKDDQYIYTIFDEDEYQTMKIWDINGKLVRQSFTEDDAKTIFGYQMSNDNKTVQLFKNCVMLTQNNELLWISGQYTLVMTQCSFENIQNLSKYNQMLMQQYQNGSDYDTLK